MDKMYENFEAISFDFFDTLVVRKIASPEDILLFLELTEEWDPRLRQRFHVERRLARKSSAALQDIYKAIFLDENIVAKFLKLEIEMETRLIEKRREGWRLFENAQRIGRNVYIVTDTPHSSASISRFFSESYAAKPPGIFSSSEVGKSKATGEMFAAMPKFFNTAPGSILHIGDNFRVDVIGAKSKGLSSLYVKSQADNFYEHKNLRNFVSEFKQKRTAAESMSIGLMQYRWFDHPLNSAFNGDLRQFGYMAYGPLILSVVIWMIEDLKKRGIKQLFCLSRDGHIINSVIHDIIRRFGCDLSVHYIYASRQIFHLLAIENELHLRAMIDKSRPVSSEIFRIFGGRPVFWSEQMHSMSLDNLLTHHGGVILDDIRRQRRLYECYLSDCGVRPGSAIFDIGYQGTSQRALERILGGDLVGYFIQCFPHFFEAMPPAARSRVNEWIDRHLNRGPWLLFQRYRLLHEAVFSAGHGSFRGFDINSEPVFSLSRPPHGLERVHDGIKIFIRDFIESWPFASEKIDISPAFALNLAHSHYSAPTDSSDIRMFSKIYFDDRFAGIKSRRLIADRRQNTAQGNLAILWREGNRQLGNESKGRSLGDIAKAIIGIIIVFILQFMILNAAKRRKIQRDPVAFFADSRFSILRILMYVYF